METTTIIIISLTIIPVLLCCQLITILSCYHWKTIKTWLNDLFDEELTLKIVIPITFILLCCCWITALSFTIMISEWSVIEFIIVILEIFPLVIILIRLIWGLFQILRNLFLKKIKNNYQS